MSFFNPNTGRQQNYGGFPGAVPPGAGIPPLPPLYSESRRNAGPPIPAENECYQSYLFDGINEVWSLDDVKNGISKKRKHLVHKFSIQSAYFILDAVTKQLRYNLVRYCSPESRLAIVPANSYWNRKFIRHFPGLSIFPNCSDRILNGLIWFMIRNAPASTLTLFPHHGFMLIDDDKLAFAGNLKDPLIPDEILPSGLKNRTVARITECHEILREWQAVFGAHPKLMLLGLIMVSSLLLFFFEGAQLLPDFLLIMRPSSGVNAEQLKAIMCLFDDQYCPIPSLECHEDRARQYLSSIWDATALFSDNSFADESQKIEKMLRFLMKCAADVAEIERMGRNIKAVISQHAIYSARRLSEGKLISVGFEDVTLNADCNQLRRLTKGMEAAVITAVESSPQNVREFFNAASRQLHGCEAKNSLSGNGSERTINMLCATAVFLSKYLSVETLTSKAVEQLLNDINQQSDLIQTSDEAIINEWADVLSSHIRYGDYTVQRKRRGMRVDPTQRIVFVDGNRIEIGAELMGDMVHEMTITNNLRSLINALKANGYLKSTDGDTHPFQSHDINNKPVRLYLYDIDAELLDADVLHILQNIDSAEFWIHFEAAPKHDFVMLLTDGVGKIAGQQIYWQDADNAHVLVTGQSGAGKSYWLCQWAAQCCALGHWVIIMDSSDSFSCEEMCRNLPEPFVNDHVIFRDFETDGIPVDLFHMDRGVKKATRIKTLLGLLTAGIGPLSTSQTNTLRKVLSNLLDLLDESEPIRPDDILALLDEDGATYESLRNRLEPLFEEINGYGMGSGDWGEVLNRGYILVLRTNPSFAAKGNQLFDILFASLHNFKRQHKDMPLDIIVDEAQNQSFSDDSPLRKLLKEGRSSRLSVCIATQDFYGSNTELGSAVGKVGLQVFFRPTNNSRKLVAEELNLRKEEAAALDNMLRGEAIMKGSFYSTGLNRNNPATLRGKVCRFGEVQLSTPHHHNTEVPECQDTAMAGGTEDEKEQ